MEVQIPLGSKPKVVFKDNSNGKNVYSIYIYDDIGYPDEYIKELRTLDSAQSHDLVNIYIGSNGGMLDTTIALVEHIRKCKAQTIALVSFAASAATVIALACDGVYMYPHSYFMTHNFSTASSGKGAELKARASFDDEWSKAIFEDLYAGFMTEQEIILMREDKDFWLLRDDVNNRLRTIEKYVNIT
jgi:ATP-dependent protease ClpP protease subunit